MPDPVEQAVGYDAAVRWVQLCASAAERESHHAALVEVVESLGRLRGTIFGSAASTSNQREAKDR